MENLATMRTQLRIVEETDVDPGLNDAIVDILAECFPHWRQVYGKQRKWRGNVPLFSLVLQDDGGSGWNGRVYAHLCVVERRITVGGKELRIAGIANVGVLPEYRGKRHIGRLLRNAMKEAEKRNLDVGMLFAQEAVKKVYARNGWVEVGPREFIRTENGKKTGMPPDSAGMFFPLKKKRFPPGTVDLQGDKW